MNPVAILVGLETHAPGGVDVEASLAELGELAEAAGADVADHLTQVRDAPDPSHFVGGGKVLEVAEAVRRHDAAIVMFDDPLSPAQLRNIENSVGCLVMDRYQLILDIFACRARSREGQLQVELAQLEYLLPRLAGRGVDLSRLGGGIGTRGPGETKLEVDRRKINDRIARIRRQLDAVDRQRQVQGRLRRQSPLAQVALVGYTNAGKSTLFRALTGEEVLVSGEPFSTLDPLIRRIQLPDGREALLSDTVGFIRKLPHALVAAFRATLDEVREADVLLNVIDVSSDPDAQVRAVEQVLRDLEVGDVPRIDVLNKIDRIEDRTTLDAMLPRFRSGVAVSALENEGLDELLRCIARRIADRRKPTLFRIPQQQGDVIAELYERGDVRGRWYEDGAVLLRAEVEPAVARRLGSFVVADRRPRRSDSR